MERAEAAVSRRTWTTTSRSTPRWRSPRACTRSARRSGRRSLLVILVVFVFLQGWRATLIPLLAVPVSLIGTFIVFPAVRILGQHALALRPGAGHRAGGRRRHRRRRGGRASHRGGPVARATRRSRRWRKWRARSWRSRIILAAVFVPTAFIPGITGRLYQQFALTIAISVMISAFNALSLSPALCALLLRPEDRKRAARSAVSIAGSTASSAGATDGYVGISRVLIRKSVVCLARCSAASPWRRWSARQAAARGVPARGGSRLRLRRRCSCPMPSSLQRTDAAAQQGRGDSEAHARRAALHLGHRLQPAEHGVQHLQRVLLRDVQAVVASGRSRRSNTTPSRRT